MTAPSTKFVGAGFRHGQIMVLGSDGYPVAAAVKTNVYEGLALERGRELTINFPEPRTVAHRGDDVIFAIQMLPPDTAITGAYKTGVEDLALEQALTGNKVVQVGEINLINVATNLAGFEYQVAVIAQQAGQPAGKGTSDVGVAGWNQIIFPKAWLIPRTSGMSEAANPFEKNYALVPTMSSKYPWGLDMTANADGCLAAFFQKGNSQFPMWWANFKGDSSVTQFSFSTSYQAVSTSKMAVYVNGTLQTSGITKATDKITFSVAPADNANIAVIYEVANIP